MNHNVKVITMHQPWASLVAHGIKQWDARLATTDHRGSFWIYAADTDNSATKYWWHQPWCREPLEQLGYTYESLPRGKIVGYADLHSVHPYADQIWSLDENQRMLSVIGLPRLVLFHYTNAYAYHTPWPFTDNGNTLMWEADKNTIEKAQVQYLESLRCERRAAPMP